MSFYEGICHQHSQYCYSTLHRYVVLNVCSSILTGIDSWGSTTRRTQSQPQASSGLIVISAGRRAAMHAVTSPLSKIQLAVILK